MARLLYIEDHEIFGAGVVDTILADHDIVWARDVMEAMLCWDEGARFDAVLTDFDLPGAKGTEFVLWLRERGDRTPILAHSSHDRGNASLLAAGADAVCAKMDVARLPEAVRALLSGASDPDPIIRRVAAGVFLERLRAVLPVVADWAPDLDEVDVDLVERALAHHEVEIRWAWGEAVALPGILSGWTQGLGGTALVHQPGCDGAVHEVAPESMGELPGSQDPFAVGESVVLGAEARGLGLVAPDLRRAWVVVGELVRERIDFYSVTHEYGEFSNFAAYPIQVEGKTWPTSEHYFQAKKFEGTAHEEQVRRASTPMEAARMGRSRKRPLRRDWESVKLDVMRRALRAKFTQHDDLRALLLATRDAELVEHTSNDAYWGDGGDRRGQNWLGRLLMELREGLGAE